jgi:hypothetical protein
MKRVLLLALAMTFALGLMQSEVFAKNNKGSDSYSSSAVQGPSGSGRSRDREEWQDLTPDQRKELRERYRRFQNLSPEEQQRLRQRYERFRELSPERRQKMKERHERLQRLSPKQREQLRREWRQLKELPPEQRSQRRRELRRQYFNDSGSNEDRENGRGRGR